MEQWVILLQQWVILVQQWVILLQQWVFFFIVGQPPELLQPGEGRQLLGQRERQHILSVGTALVRPRYLKNQCKGITNQISDLIRNKLYYVNVRIILYQNILLNEQHKNVWT